MRAPSITRCFERSIPQGSFLRVLLMCVLFYSGCCSGLLANMPAEKLSYHENAGPAENRVADQDTTIRSPRIISGRVANAKGEHLPDVSVQIKGTARGAMTNKAGEYELISHDPNGILVFSYVGYIRQEIPISGKTVINLVMQLDSTGQEQSVVVVGYGTQKKVSVTGAISSVSVTELQKTSTPSLSNAIAGKLPGIITRQSSGEPGADQAGVFIRGLGTFGTNRSPLILVDGIQRSMDNLNVEEIESFSILKDASATAVYGVRGANGVILINTKHGSKGKAKTSFRTETAWLHALRRPEYVNGVEYATLMNEALVREGGAPQYTEEDLELFRNGSDPYFHPSVDWVDEVLKENTYQTINNLNISGGSDLVRYFVNLGYTLSDGLYKESRLNDYDINANVKRYNFRSNVDFNLSQSFTLQVMLGGIIQHANYPGSGSGTGTGSAAIFDAIRLTSPIAFPVRNPDGSPGGTVVTGGLGGSNPWARVTQTGYLREDRNTLQGTVDANWDLSKLVTKGLSVRGRASYDHYYNGDQIRRKQYEVKTYLGKDGSGVDQYTVQQEASALGYEVVHDVTRRFYTEVAANYNRTIGDHDLSAMVLGNMGEDIYISAGTSMANIPQRRLGLAGRLTYGFSNRYFAEFNFGYNGSENFPKGKRFGFFPAASAGWVVSNESFWKIDFINQLKIRGSYGLVGNDDIGQRFLYVSRINKLADGYRFGTNQTFYNGYAEDLIANEDVTWEVATKKNIGLDVSFLNSKITLQVDAYDEVRNDILLTRRTVPDVSGYLLNSIPYSNMGKVRNRGIDALVEVRNTTSKGLFYSARGNFTFARNKLLITDEPIQPYPYLSEIGQPIGRQFGLVALGLFESEEDITKSPVQSYSTARVGDIKYKDMNDDNVINDLDRTYIGAPRLPEISFGFGGTVAYKGFDVSLYFTGTARTSIFLNGRSMYPFLDGFGTANVLKEYYDNRWSPDNTDGYYPGVGTGTNLNNFRTSTYYMRDGSYLRLRNAEIGYTLPGPATDRLKMNKIRFFINGLNLYTWDKVKIIDPEADNGTGYYPLQRSINFGALINF